jgi:hypothetical protein
MRWLPDVQGIRLPNMSAFSRKPAFLHEGKMQFQAMA